MNVKTNKSLEINLVGDEIKNLQSALKKVIDNGKKIGFQQIGLDKSEEQVIVDIANKIES